MNFEGFCLQCLCASCADRGTCEILHPSTEDFCMYYCQGGEFSVISCDHYKEKAASPPPKEL
ncbi:hypothetical protein [Desulfosporosinus sp. FKA]|uniref:hypothetical protein n=1 Tax=Desulfosporosinus sp. FKA TaxID=1969834 RepID=UPI000B4A4E01|nr:hypothetical protein [Desulfosporosinus sp. FKA]